MATSKRTTAKAKGAASSTGRRPAASAASAPARPAARRPAPSSASAATAPSSKRTRIPVPTEPSPVEEIVIPTLSPSELYRQEKQRRSKTVRNDPDPLAEARREYLALLAAEAEKGKGGRPKGSGKKKEEPIEED